MNHAALADHILATSYVPALGPIHPAERRPDLWQRVLGNNGTRRFLDFDKAQFWSDSKEEVILTEHITDTGDFALVPVLDQEHKFVAVHCYGDLDQAKSTARDLAVELAAHYCTDHARLRWYTAAPEPGEHRSVRLQLKTFDPLTAPPLTTWGVDPLADQPPGARESFTGFAAEASDGFDVLALRLRMGIDDGPILTVRHLARIVGAIGPMRNLPDSTGAPRLLPQYFAVLPEHRGRGYGRSLWNAAMAWGQANGAAYQLLQTEIDSPSDRICQAEGLTSLGVIHTQDLPL